MPIQSEPDNGKQNVCTLLLVLPSLLLLVSGVWIDGDNLISSTICPYQSHNYRDTLLHSHVTMLQDCQDSHRWYIACPCDVTEQIPSILYSMIPVAASMGQNLTTLVTMPLAPAIPPVWQGGVDTSIIALAQSCTAATNQINSTSRLYFQTNNNATVIHTLDLVTSNHSSLPPFPFPYVSTDRRSMVIINDSMIITTAQYYLNSSAVVVLLQLSFSTNLWIESTTPFYGNKTFLGMTYHPSSHHLYFVTALGVWLHSLTDLSWNLILQSTNDPEVGCSNAIAVLRSNQTLLAQCDGYYSKWTIIDVPHGYPSNNSGSSNSTTNTGPMILSSRRNFNGSDQCSVFSLQIYQTNQPRGLITFNERTQTLYASCIFSPAALVSVQLLDSPSPIVTSLITPDLCSQVVSSIFQDRVSNTLLFSCVEGVYATSGRSFYTAVKSPGQIESSLILDSARHVLYLTVDTSTFEKPPPLRLFRQVGLQQMDPVILPPSTNFDSCFLLNRALNPVRNTFIIACLAQPLLLVYQLTMNKDSLHINNITQITSIIQWLDSPIFFATKRGFYIFDNTSIYYWNDAWPMMNLSSENAQPLLVTFNITSYITLEYDFHEDQWSIRTYQAIMDYSCSTNRNSTNGNTTEIGELLVSLTLDYTSEYDAFYMWIVRLPDPSYPEVWQTYPEGNATENENITLVYRGLPDIIAVTLIEPRSGDIYFLNTQNSMLVHVNMSEYDQWRLNKTYVDRSTLYELYPGSFDWQCTSMIIDSIRTVYPRLFLSCSTLFGASVLQMFDTRTKTFIQQPSPVNVAYPLILQLAFDDITGVIIVLIGTTYGPGQLVQLSEAWTCGAGLSWEGEQGECLPCDVATERGFIPFEQAVQAIPQCEPCQVGRFSRNIGSSECQQCPAGSYSNTTGALFCTYCAPNQYSNIIGASSPCQWCPGGSEANHVGSTECIPCQPGFYTTPGSLCTGCPANTYFPSIDSQCLSCTDDDQEGLQCLNGIASVEPGWWAYKLDNSNKYITTQCPPGYCPGGPLQVSNVSEQLIYCDYPRLNSPENWLCAECVSDHIAWGSSCEPCTRANFGLIFLVIILATILVIFLLRASSAAGPLTILVFFAQIAALELGPVSKWIDWIQFANFGATSTRSCLLPISPITQNILTMMVPLMLFVILTLVGCVNRFLSTRLLDGDSSSYRFIQLLYSLTRDFSIDRYIGCAMAILIFCYTSTTVTCVQSLHCVQVAPGINRLFSAPSIDCNSHEYTTHLLPVAVLFLIVYVIGFPFVMFIFLWRSSHTILHLGLASSSQSLNDSGPSSNLSSAAISKFVSRWSHFYVPYRFSIWYWQPISMLRRFVFALVSVLLIRNTIHKYLMYSGLGLLSLLSHQYLRPFISDQMNSVETMSYVILIYLSLLLASQTSSSPSSSPSSPSSSSSFSVSVQVVSGLLVIPFGFVLVILTLRMSWRNLRGTKRSYQHDQEPQQHARSVQFHMQSTAYSPPPISSFSPSPTLHELADPLLP